MRHAVVSFVFVALLPNCAFGSADLIIEMDEFSYDPAELTVQPDRPVTVEVKNIGDVAHDIVITREVFELSSEALSAIIAKPEIVVGRTDRVAPGESERTTVTLDEPGVYQYFCSVVGHFDPGMRGVVTVEP